MSGSRAGPQSGSGIPAPAEAWREIESRLRAAGFPLVGACPAAPSRFAPEFREWLRQGCHGEMAYMAEAVEERLDPAALVPGARSVICVALRYHDGRGDAALPGPEVPGARPRGRVARYARGRDYHEVLRERLEPLAREWRTRWDPHRFRICVDTAPLLEREHAARAGLGRVGKHTLLIGRTGGSWLLLGGIVTTMELPVAESAPEDPCGGCTRCIDACPTGAIEPWRVDASRCLSYLTIEHAGPVAPALAAGVGEWLFGCDICQEVCPHNQPTRRSRRMGAEASLRGEGTIDLLQLLGWREASPERLAQTAVLRRATLAMLKRNAILILSARGWVRANAECAAALRRAAADPEEDAGVRDAALRALAAAG